MAKLIITKDNRSFLFQDKDLHTKEGFLTKDAIAAAKPGDELVTNTGKKMVALDASFIDLYNKIKRSAQVIPLKDVGAIITEVGLEPDWKIVDAGTGSGALCCFLAHLVPKGKVYTFDIRDDHLALAEKNISFLGLKNVVVQKQDIYEGAPVKDADLVTLDVPEPWRALQHAESALQPGGFLVSYSPSIAQVSDFVEAVRKTESLRYLKTLEINQREWEFDQRKQKPLSPIIGHSGFLSFCRKIGK